MARRRNMLRATSRRSKERQRIRSLRDAEYQADCKDMAVPSSRFAGIVGAWTTAAAYCAGKVRVGHTMVPRGRRVEAAEWRDLNERARLKYNLMVKVIIVPNNDVVNGAVAGGKGTLFFSDEESVRIRQNLSSGKPKEDFLQMMADMRLDAARQRREKPCLAAKLGGEGAKALGVRERGAELVPSLC